VTPPRDMSKKDFIQLNLKKKAANAESKTIPIIVWEINVTGIRLGNPGKNILR
jgi:hypothetical protein